MAETETRRLVETVAKAITEERYRLARKAMAGGSVGLGFDDEIGLALATVAIASTITTQAAEIAALRAALRPILKIIATMYEEYNKDDCCDYVRINGFIEDLDEEHDRARSLVPDGEA